MTTPHPDPHPPGTLAMWLRAMGEDPPSLAASDAIDEHASRILALAESLEGRASELLRAVHRLVIARAGAPEAGGLQDWSSGFRASGDLVASVESGGRGFRVASGLAARLLALLDEPAGDADRAGNAEAAARSTDEPDSSAALEGLHAALNSLGASLQELESAPPASVQPASVQPASVQPASAQPAPAARGSDRADAHETRSPAASAPEAQQVPLVRVEARRIDELGDQVGRLVLCKNRLRRRVESLSTGRLGSGDLDAMRTISEEFELISSLMQASLMATRKRPIDRLFAGHAQAVRDAARVAGKEVSVAITGADTLVDRRVLDALADPLMNVLGFLVSGSIEAPDEREALGKPRDATVRLDAKSLGTHLIVRIEDDGCGADDAMRALAAAQGWDGPEDDIPGVVTALMAPGCERSPVAGVVESLASIRAQVDVSRCDRSGLGFRVMVPLDAAILPAMMVASGDETYAVPLQSIAEIVRLPETPDTLATHEVIRLRGEVYPIVRLHRACDASGEDRTRDALIVQSGDVPYALAVDSVLGQRKIVLRQLESTDSGGPFCGVTVREDGGLSLVLDVARLKPTAVIDSATRAN